MYNKYNKYISLPCSIQTASSDSLYPESGVASQVNSVNITVSSLPLVIIGLFAISVTTMPR